MMYNKAIISYIYLLENMCNKLIKYVLFAYHFLMLTVHRHTTLPNCNHLAYSYICYVYHHRNNHTLNKKHDKESSSMSVIEK
jgi:hypothetical protein